MRSCICSGRMKDHDSRYYIRTILSGGFCAASHGSEDEAVWNAGVHCFFVFCKQHCLLCGGHLFLVTAIRMSKVPFSFMVRGLKAILFLLLISVSFNLFLTPGIPVVQFGIFKITQEGIRTAGFMALRLIYLVIGSSVMTLTTTPNELTDGLEKSLGFLNKVEYRYMRYP